MVRRYISPHTKLYQRSGCGNELTEVENIFADKFVYALSTGNQSLNLENLENLDRKDVTPRMILHEGEIYYILD